VSLIFALNLNSTLRAAPLENVAPEQNEKAIIYVTEGVQIVGGNLISNAEITKIKPPALSKKIAKKTPKKNIGNIGTPSVEEKKLVTVQRQILWNFSNTLHNSKIYHTTASRIYAFLSNFEGSIKKNSAVFSVNSKSFLYSSNSEDAKSKFYVNNFWRSLSHTSFQTRPPPPNFFI
jgi:hypothetical protein